MLRIKFTQDIEFKGKYYRAYKEYEFSVEDLKEISALTESYILLPIKQMVSDYITKPLKY